MTSHYTKKALQDVVLMLESVDTTDLHIHDSKKISASIELLESIKEEIIQ